MVQSPAASKSDSLTLRVASTLVLAPLAVAAIWYGGLPFIVALAAVGGLAGYEWANLMNREGQLAQLWGPPLALLVIVLTAGLTKLGTGIVLAVFGGIAIFLIAILRRDSRPILTGVGVAYVALALVAMLGLRLRTDDGLAWSLLLCAVVWATDIGAYVAGRTIGGPKLAPTISPSKTWAGLMGGIVAAVAAALLVFLAFRLWEAASIAVLAVALALTAQGGDLLESFIKRRSGAGDSGRLIPGHGGVLDRIDGLMPAAMLLFAVIFFSEQGQS